MTTPTADPLHTFRAPAELWAAAQAKATRRHEAVSDVLRRALTTYIEDDAA